MRFSGKVSEDLKQNIIPMRTSSAAFHIAVQKGYDVTKKQLLNLKRSVPNALVGKCGRRVVTTLADVKVLADQYPSQTEYYINQSNELVFRYFQIYEDSLKLFVSGCPFSNEFEHWKNTVNSLKYKPLNVIKEELKDVLLLHPSGLVFPSRLFIDTTYNLSDCYVTVLLGESARFRTKTSGKPRVFPIAYLLHSHRDAENHQFFANNLKATVDRLLVDRAAPSILMDGEQSL